MFDESKHPRDDVGRFTYSDGLGGTHIPTEAELQRLLEIDAVEPKEQSRQEIQKKRVCDYVERFREGKGVESEIVLSDVGEKEREAIEKLTGEKLTATKHVLSLDELRHIEKRHGMDGEHDHSMADISRYEKIIDILKYPDRVEFCVDEKGEQVYSKKYMDKNNMWAKLITFKKSYSNYEQMVVEAVYDSKKGKLHIVTTYAKKREP